MERYRDKNIGKQVYQYNALTGGLVAYYRNTVEAARTVKTNPVAIEKACNGDIKSVNGYYWNYVLVPNFRYKSDKRKKQVFQFSKEGEFLNSFNSVAEAARETQVNKTSIAKCCRGEYNSAGNYNWEYKSENLRNDEGDSI